MSPNHAFTVILDRAVTDELADALFEAGLDDAGIGNYDGEPAAEFDREADTLLEAIVSAIRDIWKVDGITPVRVVGDELVSQADIAERTGKSRQAVNHWIRRDWVNSNFPAPTFGGDTRSPLWRWADVAEWLVEKQQLDHYDTERDRIIAMVNGLLTAVAFAESPDEVRRLLFALAA